MNSPDKNKNFQKASFEKAFILAGGAGIRLHPFSKKVPKPLFQVGTETLLERNIRLLDEAFDIKEIFIITGYKSEQITSVLSQIKSGTSSKLRLREIPKNYLAGGLLAGYAFIDSLLGTDEGYFIAVLADEFYGENDHKRLSPWIEKKCRENLFSACCAIRKFQFPEEYFQNYAVCFDVEKQLIERIEEKPKKIISPYYGLGLIIAKRDFARRAKQKFESGKKENLIDLLNEPPNKTNNRSLIGFEYRDCYVNINTKTDYYRALSVYREENFQAFKVSLIIPAWNEAESIAYVIDDFRAKCHEIIVMDNLSEDGTAQVARDKGATVYSEKLSGYGDALKKGLDKAGGDILVLVEADGTFRSGDMQKLFAYLKDSDAVVGTRTYWQYVEHGANMPFLQRMGNICFGIIITLLWWNRRSRFSDVGCTYKAMWKQSYEKIRPYLTGKGPEFSPEIIIELLNQWQRLIEVPVPYHPRILGQSKFSGSFYHTAKTALKMLALILKKRVKQWLSNIFVLSK